MAEYDALYKPLRIKGLTIRNRVMSTGHVPGYASGGRPTERYFRYHEEKAKGGIGLTVFGGTSAVSAEHTAAMWSQLSVADDSIVPFLAEFADRVHRHGAAVMMQLDHMGRRMRWDNEHWFPAIAPSPIPEPGHRSFPRTMDKYDIRRVIGDFAQATRRAKDAGLDGVEISAAGPHILAQFWSPYCNKRTDEYGGTFDNRMRFSLEILEEVRCVVGPEFVLGLRSPGDELTDGGLTPDDCLEIAKRLASSGMVDFLNVYGGQSYDHLTFSMTNMNMSYPVAPYLHLPSAIRAEVDIPIFHAQRINDIRTAARAVADGHVDMVGMTRAHIADPHIVEKLRDGRVEDIRQCVGASYCIDRLTLGLDALCLHNAATGREETMPHKIPKTGTKRKVAVAGAGPAGLEAARVCAERGHQVVLFEADDKVGGQINLANKPGWRESMSGIARWLELQVRKLNVDMRLSNPATVANMLAEGPDVVIVATGGAPNRGDFAGSEYATTTWDILSGRVEPGKSVLVYDDNGDHQAPSCAQYLAQSGSIVELAYPDRHGFIDVGHSNAPIHLRELYKNEVVLSPDLRLHQIYKEGNQLIAVLRNEYSQREEERAVDQVVSEQGTIPVDDLFHELRPKSRNGGELDVRAVLGGRPQGIIYNSDGLFDLFRVGDCVASRNIHAAIYDSLRLCKDL